MSLHKGTHAHFKSLGNILVMRGYCTQDEINKAIAAQNDRAIAERTMIGPILVEMGFCTQWEIDQCIRDQQALSIESCEVDEKAGKDIQSALDRLDAKLELAQSKRRT